MASSLFCIYFFVMAFYTNFFVNTVAAQAIFTIVMGLYELLLFQGHLLFFYV